MSRATRYPRTKAQREFRTRYWQETGFQFCDDTTRPFDDQARWNVNWYESHTQDVLSRISKEMHDLIDC